MRTALWGLRFVKFKSIKENRSFDLLIDDSELKQRLDAWVAPEPRATKGTLGLYARYASSHATEAYIL